jgi:hypothetical protein
VYIERVVVGGGIIGRAASYLTGAQIIEQGVPGYKNFSGLYYLHPSEGMDRLLMALGVTPEVEEVKAGVVWWRKPEEVKYLSSGAKIEAVESYCMKTRGCRIDELAFDDLHSVMDSLLDDKVMQRYKISFSQFGNLMYEQTHHNTLYGARVESVLWGDRFFRIWDSESQTPTRIQYKHMIVAAPLKSVIKGPTPDLIHEPSYYYTFAVKDNSWVINHDYAYWYLVGSDLEADRITFPSRLGENVPTNIVCVESINRLKDDGYAFLDHMEVGRSKLITSGSNPYKRLLGNALLYLHEAEDERNCFVGRYARWDNSLTVSDAVDRLLEVAQ